MLYAHFIDSETEAQRAKAISSSLRIAMKCQGKIGSRHAFAVLRSQTVELTIYSCIQFIQQVSILFTWVNIHVGAHVCAGMRIHVCVGVWRPEVSQPWVSFLSTLFSETGLFIGLRGSHEAVLASQ